MNITIFHYDFFSDLSILGKSNPPLFNPLRIFAMLNGHTEEVPPLLHSTYGNHLGLDYYPKNHNNNIKTESKNGYMSNGHTKYQDPEKSEQNRPRLVSKDGSCMIRPLNLENPWMQIFR